MIWYACTRPIHDFFSAKPQRRVTFFGKNFWMHVTHDQCPYAGYPILFVLSSFPAVLDAASTVWRSPILHALWCWCLIDHRFTAFNLSLAVQRRPIGCCQCSAHRLIDAMHASDDQLQFVPYSAYRYSRSVLCLVYEHKTKLWIQSLRFMIWFRFRL